MTTKSDLDQLHAKIDNLSNSQKIHYLLIIAVGAMVAYSVFF